MVRQVLTCDVVVSPLPPHTTNKPPSHVYPRGLLPCLPSVGCAGWLAAGLRPPGNLLPGANSTIKQKKDLGKKKKNCTQTIASPSLAVLGWQPETGVPT